MSNDCSDCNDPPGPGSFVRLVGRDHAGNVITLCSRCWIRRDRDANVPAIGKTPGPAKSKSKKARSRSHG